MSDESEKVKRLRNFFREGREGYDEQDAKIENEGKNFSDRIKEGLVTGGTEAIAHPIRWLRSFLT
jgi:hypothetical protein